MYLKDEMEQCGLDHGADMRVLKRLMVVWYRVQT